MIEEDIEELEPSPLSDEDKEQIAGEIENEGLGYWALHYGYGGSEDPVLAELCAEAQEALRALNSYLINNEIHV